MQPDSIRNLTNANGVTFQDNPMSNNYPVLTLPVNPSYYQDRVNLGSTQLNQQIAQLQSLLLQASNIIQQMSGIMPYNGSVLSQSDSLTNLLSQSYNATGQVYGDSGISNSALDPQLRQLLDMTYGAINDTNQFMQSLPQNEADSNSSGIDPQLRQLLDTTDNAIRNSMGNLPNSLQSPFITGQPVFSPDGREIGRIKNKSFNMPINNQYNAIAQGLKNALEKNPSKAVNILSQLTPEQRAIAERQYGDNFGSGDYTKLRTDLDSRLNNLQKIEVTQLLDQGGLTNPLSHAIALKHTIEQKPFVDADRIKALLNISDPGFLEASMKYYNAISPNISFEDALKNAPFKKTKDKNEILEALKYFSQESNAGVIKGIEIRNKNLSDERDNQIAELTAERIHEYRYSKAEQEKVTEKINELTPDQLALTEILYGQKYGEGDFSKLRKDLENNSNTEGLKKLNEIALSNPSSAAIAIKAALDKDTNWFNHADADSIKTILNAMNEEQIAQMVQEYNTISPDKTLTTYIKEQDFSSDTDKENILQVIQQAVYRYSGKKGSL